MSYSGGDEGSPGRIEGHNKEDTECLAWLSGKPDHPFLNS